MRANAPKPLSVEERLDLLEAEHSAQTEALRVGLAWLMARTCPVEASAYLTQQAQELELAPAPDSPHHGANQALGAALTELADQLDDFRALPQSVQPK